MHWKRSVSVIASGAAAAAGLVWLVRGFRKAPVEREEWDSPRDALGAGPAELPKPALTFPDDVEEELMAADDAREDIGEDALDFETSTDPDDVDAAERMETVHTHEQRRLSDEPYDALDADDLGTEWLFRATASSPPERVATAEEVADRVLWEAENEKP
jgi:hypothetical protein